MWSDLTRAGAVRTAAKWTLQLPQASSMTDSSIPWLLPSETTPLSVLYASTQLKVLPPPAPAPSSSSPTPAAAARGSAEALFDGAAAGAAGVAAGHPATAAASASLISLHLRATSPRAPLRCAVFFRSQRAFDNYELKRELFDERVLGFFIFSGYFTGCLQYIYTP